MLLHPREVSQIKSQLTKTLKPNLLNTLLNLLTISQTPEKILPIYTLMFQNSPPLHDHFTYTYVLKSCSLRYETVTGHAIHARILQTGHHADLFIQNSLISFYSSASDPSAAKLVFMGIGSPDVVSWTSIVSALAKNGRELEAMLLFASMDSQPNEMTLVSVLTACARRRDRSAGKAIHGFGLKRFGCHDCKNLILGNAMLEMYVNCGDFLDALNLFGEMPVRDVISWTTMISGYVRNSSLEDAMALFVLMIEEGDVAPNEATLASVLRTCASMGCLGLGRSVHSYIEKRRIGTDVIVGNALINMYAKCGEVGMAIRVFVMLLFKDSVSWSTIIGGMALNGMVKQALQLFCLMLCHGVEPDAAVFAAVLSACCHAGLVSQASMIFNAMNKVYVVLPQKEHFTIMVDAYGRAGLLEEAEQLIRTMPIELDGHVRGALLNAYKIHGGGGGPVYEGVRRQILETEVVAGGGTYALVCNMLANSERWEDSDAVREKMRVRGVRKVAGCSWIEVDKS